MLNIDIRDQVVPASTLYPKFNDLPQFAAVLRPDLRQYGDAFDSLPVDDPTVDLNGRALQLQGTTAATWSGTVISGTSTSKPQLHAATSGGALPYAQPFAATGQTRASFLSDFEDGELAMEFINTGVGSVALAARLDVATGGIQALMSGTTGQVILRTYTSLGGTGGFPTASEEFQSGTVVPTGVDFEHRMRLTMDGDHFEVFVDDKLYLEAGVAYGAVGNRHAIHWNSSSIKILDMFAGGYS